MIVRNSIDLIRIEDDDIEETLSLYQDYGMWMQGHKDFITTTAICIERMILYTGSSDCYISVWDISNCSLIYKYKAHSDKIFRMIIGKDSILLSCSFDSTIKCWSTTDYTLMYQIFGNCPFYTICFVDHEKMILSGNKEGVLSLWNTKNRVWITQEKLSGLIWNIKASCNNKYAAISVFTRTLLIWGIKERAVIREILHPALVFTICFDNQCRYMFSGCNDHGIRVFLLGSFELVTVLVGHQDVIRSLKITPDNSYLISCGSEPTFRLWDIQNMKLECLCLEHTHYVHEVEATGEYIISASWDKTIKLWDIHDKQYLKEFNAHNNQITSIYLSYCDNRVITTDCDGVIKVWNAEDKRISKNYKGHKESIASVGRTRKFIVSGDLSCLFFVWKA